MSQLDDALKAYIEDENQQETYYQLFLTTDFYVPLAHQGSPEEIDQHGGVTPMILESAEKPYMMLFDGAERLAAWARKDVPYAIFSGAAIAQFSPAGLYWAVNMGDKYAKEMVPDEITFLKQLAIAGSTVQ